MPALSIPALILDQMLKQAKDKDPIEACGILAGTNGQVEKYYPMTNVDNSSDHFMMAPSEQFSIIKDMRKSGIEMLAISHSHPATQARPSQEDIRLALTPDVIYTILSLEDSDNPVLKGFLIEKDTIEEIPVTIMETQS